MAQLSFLFLKIMFIKNVVEQFLNILNFSLKKFISENVKLVLNLHQEVKLYLLKVMKINIKQ